MGCDFDLFVQACLRGQWHTWFHGCSKTGCGGFPICAAVRQLCKQQSNIGHCHADEPVVAICSVDADKEDYETEIMRCEEERQRIDELNIMATASGEYNSVSGTKLRESAKEQRNLEEYLSDLHGNMMSGHVSERSCMLFSVVEFEKFLAVLMAVEEESAASEDFEGNRMLYSRIFKHVPTLANELSLAGPSLDCEWVGFMNDDDEIYNTWMRTLRTLHNTQSTRAKGWLSNLCIILKPLKLPGDAMQMVASFSVPRAEMRIALRDDEGQIQAARAGNLTAPECCVM